MKQRQISFSPPDISEEEINEVRQALRSGWITTGPRTKEFEQEIAAYCHTEKAVCLNSATACMELILRILGVGPGDEVITSAYTYTATASVTCSGIFRNGLRQAGLCDHRKNQSRDSGGSGRHRLRLRPYFRSGRKP